MELTIDYDWRPKKGERVLYSEDDRIKQGIVHSRMDTNLYIFPIRNNEEPTAELKKKLWRLWDEVQDELVLLDSDRTLRVTALLPTQANELIHK